MKTDIEIAQATKLAADRARSRKRLGIPDEALEPYGRYKAKISLDWLATQPRRSGGKLVLVSAISPTPAGEGKTTTTVGTDRCAEPHRQPRHRLPARALARPGVRHEGRCGGGRLRAGRADGGHQSAFHRRLPCDRRRPQPARRADRQSRPSRQCARHRRAAHRLEARHRHERPRVARDDRRPRRPGQRLSAPGRLRHRRGLGGHGDLLPRHDARRSQAAARQYRLCATRATSGPCMRAILARMARWLRCSAMRSRRTSCRRSKAIRR